MADSSSSQGTIHCRRMSGLLFDRLVNCHSGKCIVIEEYTDRIIDLSFDRREECMCSKSWITTRPVVGVYSSCSSSNVSVSRGSTVPIASTRISKA